MTFQRLFFSAAWLFLAMTPVRADVMYQCVDETGHKSFSNIKSAGKGSKCTPMDLGAPVTVPGAKGAAKTPTPASFPKVDDNAQKSRDNDRLRILNSELATEQKNLEQAKKELAAQNESALPEERNASRTTCVPVQQCSTGPTGKTCKTVQSCTKTLGGINNSEVDERLQPYQDKVALHERNIEAIQKEIAKLR